MSKRDDPQLRVRIPEDLKAELEVCARENKRTLTAEIVDRLSATLEQDNFWLVDSLGYRRFTKEYEELQDKYNLLKSEAGYADLFKHFGQHEPALREAINTLKNYFDGKLK
ncbi:Arc family DNA-binding protein [Salmonella enterica]|nr:Arc family DNA-binding protein [Salmonella enterica]EIZ2109688.1 Arc family DNA-binding protein [Salmonella enterica]